MTLKGQRRKKIPICREEQKENVSNFKAFIDLDEELFPIL